MVNHKYGKFTQEQMREIKHKLRKKIFYLLVACENELSQNEIEMDKAVSVDEAFTDVQNEIKGLNDLLGNPPEMAELPILLNAAHIEYKNPDFEWSIYRKLVLDAGACVLSIKEV